MPGVYAPDERLPHSCMCCMRNAYAFRNDLDCKMVHCVYSDGPQIWKDGRLESCKLRYIEGAPFEKAQEVILRDGCRVYYADETSSEIEEGTAKNVLYQGGKLWSFGVDFGNDFDEFYGSALGSTIFISKAEAEAKVKDSQCRMTNADHTAPQRIEGVPSEKAPTAEKTAKTGEVILNHCPNCHIVTANDNGWHRRGEHDDTRICEICGSEMKCYKPWLSPWWLENEAKLHDEWMEKNMIVVTDIVWDADEDDRISWRTDAEQFPKEVLIPRDRIIYDGEGPLSDEELADRVVTYLEDEYEFCVDCCAIDGGDLLCHQGW